MSLYACLLTGRLFAYFRYRLRFALLLDATGFVVHVAEFLIILTSLGGLAAFTIMFLRVGSLVISGAWWGLLEIMRERLRVFSQGQQRDATEREIGCWLVLSAIAGSALTIAGGVVLTFGLSPDHHAVGRFYAFLVVVELALRLPVRVLHSGMYATRRIYRPLWTLFAPMMLQLLVLGVGVFIYPAAAVVVAIVASNALGIWITVHYTLAVYRLTGLRPRLASPGQPPRRLLPSIPPRLGAETALAGVGLRLDAVAVLAIAGIYGTNTRTFDLTAGFSGWRDIDAFQFFYLTLPLFRGGYEATGLFYFDFVRLRRMPAFRQFRISVFHKLLWTTPVIALFFWSLATALGLYVLPDVPFSFLLALLPLFILRSTIGTYQMRLFAEGQFGLLIATVAFTAGLFTLVWIDGKPASDLVQITAAMITVLIVHINLQHFQDRATAKPRLLSLGDWVRTLAREPGPVHAGRITTPEWIGPPQRSAAVTLVEQTLDGGGLLAFGSRTSLVFYRKAGCGDSEVQPHLVLQAVTGGAANRGQYWQTPSVNGRAALDRVIAENWIHSRADGSALSEDPETLKAEFVSQFPDGIVLDLQTRVGEREMRNVSLAVLAAILPAAMRSLQEGTAVITVSGRRITPLFNRGKLRLIFVLPTDTEPQQLRHWLQIVKAWQVGGRTPESVSDVHTK